MQERSHEARPCRARPRHPIRRLRAWRMKRRARCGAPATIRAPIAHPLRADGSERRRAPRVPPPIRSRSWRAACWRHERVMGYPHCVRLAAIGGLLWASLAGCVLPDPLVGRVSREFECEPPRVNVLERHDIAYELYDVEACGRRGRYSCVGGGRGGVYRCIHEPDPPKWDPDPALAATLPAAAGSDPSAPPSTGSRRRICGPNENACVFEQQGAWQWRPAPAPHAYGCSGWQCQ